MADLQKNYWFIRLGEANKFASVAQAKGCIGVSWGELSLDLTSCASLDKRVFFEEVGPKIASVYQEKSKNGVSGVAGQLFRFSVLMKEGDIVLMPGLNASQIFVGRVTSGYIYSSVEADFPFSHRRNVQWMKEISRASFSNDLRNSSGSIMTLFSLSKYAEEIDELLEGKEKSEMDGGANFGLETHLEQFMVDNWSILDLGKEYDIFEDEDGTSGQQYVIEKGRIDILARKKNSGDWLVIELKRGRESSVVVGQILHYIGWVRENLASEGEGVQGMIVVGEKDSKLEWALKPVSSFIQAKRYQVSFRLTEY